MCYYKCNFMKRWCIYIVLVSLINLIIADSFIQLTAKHGYHVEVHKDIVTPDGYLLTMHRMPHGKIATTPKKRVPVLLMHGLFGSAEQFVFLGPERSLGYLLADEGYDVWFGNVRSVSYSRHHVKYNPDRHREYWNFTMHELAVYDLTTKIDYILEKTGFDAIFYAGHSQGCFLFFLMCSTMPQYNNKITLFSGLSAPMFLNNITHPSLSIIIKHEKELTKLFEMLHWDELLLLKSFYNPIAPFFCSLPYISEICKFIIMCFGGDDYHQLDSRFFPDILLNSPEGVGRMQFFHCAQVANAGNLQRYDYGSDMNLQIYGQSNPPLYDPTRISVPIAMYYSTNDWFLPLQNLERSLQVLQNVVELYKVPYKDFSHIDFILAKDIYPLLHKRVIEVMNKHRNVSD